MLTDYHSHLLPGMDDGAPDVRTSEDMLAMWRAQEVGRVAATPHYHPHRETVEAFLSRRGDSLAMLGEQTGPVIVPGAEVAIEGGLAEVAAVDRLALGESRCILLELPYLPFGEWMLAEIYGVAHNFGLTPVLAHVERYLGWYSSGDMARVLSVRGAVLQINCDALLGLRTRRFALELIRGGFPVVFGSDAHNTARRPPSMDIARAMLRKKLKQDEFSTLMKLDARLI